MQQAFINMKTHSYFSPLSLQPLASSAKNLIKSSIPRRSWFRNRHFEYENLKFFPFFKIPFPPSNPLKLHFHSLRTAATLFTLKTELLTLAAPA
ncbi:hypothetical protein [Paenibacillus terreus]|uniref:hypothetical protein n=1 Tax=Paenibacillus terreus TaxID=1387834 RepID=UPI0035CD2E0C